MKKNRFSLISLTIIAMVALALTIANTQAQGLYPVFTGGTTTLQPYTTNTYVYGGVTNRFGAPGTSTNIAVNVSQYDTIGMTFKFTGTATSTNALYLYRSMDEGASYLAAPFFSITGIVPGAAAYQTNVAISVSGCSHIAIRTENIGSTYATNVDLSFYLKAPLHRETDKK